MTQAYTLAWRGWPHRAYHRGLVAAQAHLEALGASLPDLPPFDASQHDAMPDVEINPKDKYWVNPDNLDG